MQEHITASNIATAGTRTGRPAARTSGRRQRNVRTFAAIALAAVGAVLLAAPGSGALAAPAAAAAAAAAGTVRLLLPFPRTGPRDIHGVERATRTYRTISAYAPQPISEVLGDVAVMAASGVPGIRVLRVRQQGNRNRLDLATLDASFDEHRSIVLVSHESIGAWVAHSHARSSPDPGWIAPLADMPLVLLVTPAAAADLDRSRRQPGSTGRLPRLGSAGERSAAHFAGTLFSHALGMHYLHVPYNGGHAALNALLAQEVDLMFAALPLALPYIEAGKLPVLGLASAQRFELLPQLPTLAEAGIGDIEWEGWFALYASRTLEPALRAELRQRLRAMIASGAVRSALLARGLRPAETDPDAFSRRVVRDLERAVPLLVATEG